MKTFFIAFSIYERNLISLKLVTNGMDRLSCSLRRLERVFIVDESSGKITEEEADVVEGINFHDKYGKIVSIKI
jgi:hypothetical protein